MGFGGGELGRRRKGRWEKEVERGGGKRREEEVGRGGGKRRWGQERRKGKRASKRELDVREFRIGMAPEMWMYDSYEFEDDADVRWRYPAG